VGWNGVDSGSVFTSRTVKRLLFMPTTPASLAVAVHSTIHDLIDTQKKHPGSPFRQYQHHCLLLKEYQLRKNASKLAPRASQRMLRATKQPVEANLRQKQPNFIANY
jgi:hypothetical protein